MSRRPHHLLYLRDGRVEGDRHDVGARDHHFGGVSVAEDDRPSEETMSEILDYPLLTPGGNDDRQVLGRVTHFESIHGLHAQDSKDAIRKAVEHGDQRAEDDYECPERQCQSACETFGARNGDVLGRHLPDDHVQKHHDEQSDDESNGVGHSFR